MPHVLPLVTSLHLGELHGLEGFAVLLLLLGPLSVAVVTVFYLRWRDGTGPDDDVDHEVSAPHARGTGRGPTV